MSTIDLTAGAFEKLITEQEIVLIDFWAGWCQPCLRFAPVYEKAAETNTDIVFAKVDTEAEQELSAMFNITSIPTLMAFREGVLVYAQPGALPAQALDQVIQGVRSLDMEKVHAKVAEQAAAE